MREAPGFGSAANYVTGSHGSFAGAATAGDRCHNAASHNAFLVSIGPPDPGSQVLTAQVPHPPHEGARRNTDGFSLEKFTKVRNGHVCRGSQACRIGTAYSSPSPHEPNGSEILVRCLQAEGVEYLWGYPGGAVLYIYDALYKQASIQHVLVRHEQAAVHAADGYARATGEVGVALVTSGPGVTNAVTGIATAYMDSIPMVIITGQVPTPAIGLDAFQECDTVGITRPIVKHNFLVKDVRDLALTMKKAFHIARTGRPGPVVVDVPKDVSLQTAPFHYPERVEMRSVQPGARKATAARSARRCSCCWRPSGRTSTPAAA